MKPLRTLGCAVITKVLILLFTFACLVVMTATSQVTYAISGGIAYVTHSPNASGHIVIASTYNGYPVTMIAERAFVFCSNLLSVIIPNSVTNLGDGAFKNCTSLATVEIGSGVTYIPTRTFSGCTSLTNFSMDAANSVYSSLDGVLFDKAKENLIAFPVGRAGTYVVPEGVRSVGHFAFYERSRLASVTIGNSVTNIGLYSFTWCTSLTNVTVGDSVITLRVGTFNFCTNLTSVTFLGDAPSLPDEGAFSNVEASARVYYYYGTTGWGASYSGLPTVMLGAPAAQVDTGTAGVKPGGFGFTSAGVVNQTIVIEASTNLTTWQPVWTNTLSAVSTDFVDPQSLNHPRRFYRMRSN